MKREWVHWTSGQPRTDKFLLLLAIAPSLPDALRYVIAVAFGQASLPIFKDSFLTAASQLPSLIEWLGAAAGWLARGPGDLIPLAIGLAVLARRCPLAPGLLGIAIYWCLANIYTLVDSMTAFAGFPMVVTVLAWVLGGLLSYAARVILPAYICLRVLLARRHPERDTGHRIAAISARFALYTCATLLAIPGGGVVAAIELGGWALRGSPPGHGLFYTLVGAVNLAGATAFAVLALLCIRMPRVRVRVLRTAFPADVVRWLLGAMLYATYLFPGALPASTSAESPVWFVHAVVGLGFTLPMTGLVLWYFRPWLAYGPLLLSAAEPQCQRCGYSLRHNVSGRCPECGEPAPRAGD